MFVSEDEHLLKLEVRNQRRFWSRRLLENEEKSRSPVTETCADPEAKELFQRTKNLAESIRGSSSR